MKIINTKFKQRILALLLIVLFAMTCSSIVTAQDTHSVYNAMNAGLISTEFVSTGAASGHIADLTITSNFGEAMTIDIADSGLNGMVLENSNEDEQDEVITDTPGESEGPGETTYTPTDFVDLGPGESATIPVIGYCINYDLANPSSGTIFDLSTTSSKTDISEISSVLETLDTFSYPGEYTSVDIFDVAQISIWAGQTDNADVTLEDYSARGYDLDDNDISVVSDILNASGIDTTNIVALTGKAKEDVDGEDTEPSDTATTDDFPWVYIALPIIAIAAGAGIYAMKSKPTKPITKPGETENHVVSHSTPSTDVSDTAVKACGKSCTANCDLQCEGQCIALCERGVKGWDPNKKRGVPCTKACMGSCTMKCTSWTQ